MLLRSTSKVSNSFEFNGKSLENNIDRFFKEMKGIKKCKKDEKY